MARTRRRALAVLGGVVALAVGVAVPGAVGGAAGTGDPFGVSEGVEGISVAGKCKVSKLSFATAETPSQTTTSTTFVDIPGASVSFKLGGNAPSCIEVQFSAHTFAITGAAALVIVRALLDGTVAGTPAEVYFDGDSDEDGDGAWSRSHAFNFVFGGVAPGPHTVSIQFRSHDGGLINVHRRSVFVHHK